MKEIKVKINSRGISYKDLTEDLNIKAKAFIYIIPMPWFRPVRRVSRLYLYKPNEKIGKEKYKYNFVNYFLGWLGLPFGPSFSYNAIKSNKKGIDFTEDFRANIEELDFKKNQLIIKNIVNVFDKLNKSDRKVLIKAFSRYEKKFYSFEVSPIIGLNIDKTEAEIWIGLSKTDYNKKEELLNVIYKYFYKHTIFKIINMGDNSELIEKLKTQGEIIKLINK
ncbi:MAG: hypothetical protein ABJL44_00810 [Algibacter sp.]